ncbi:MAG: phage major capsid protein, partial [Thermomicrobium sp.]|nr:phage major capsid protein [Thermomicrobium sp.]
YYKPITLSMRQLSDAQHPDAIANLVVEQATMAKMGMADDLARDLWQSSSSNPKKLDGFRDIVDDGSFNPNYAGLARASYPILQAYVDSTSTTLSFTLIHTLISRATRGAYSPTVGYCRREQWDRLWALAMNFYQVHSELMLHDNAMFQAGFTSIVVDSVPFIVDDKVFDGPNSSNSAIVVVNENFLSLRVKNDRDFRMEPFRRLEQQDAINAMVFWEGNIVAQAPFTTAKLTNITS